MDLKQAVAVHDVSTHSKFLEDAVALIRKVLGIDCPLIHLSQLRDHVGGVEVYVVPFFEGETYEKVKAYNVPIIGPAAIIRLLREEILLPRRLKKGRNLYSLSLHGVCVCCSNIEIAVRDVLYERVEAMGGTISKALTADVTHLVVEEVGSTKYHFATKLGIPIVLSTWVNTVWQLSQTEVVKVDSSMADKFKCPVFKGCTVCVTGLDLAQRTEVQRLVTEHGGTYSGDLMMDSCTHLLCDTTEGKKFTFAQKWKIPCVRLKWFYGCIEQGYCLDIKEYRHSDKENQPEPLSGESKVQLLEETREQLAMETSTSSTSYVIKALAGLDLSLHHDKSYLDGCKIYLHGYPPADYELVKKIINYGSGTRFDVISSRVTHIVTNITENKEVMKLTVAQPEAYVVKTEWLVESLKQGVKQDEQLYVLNPIENQLPAPKFNTNIQMADNNAEELLQQYREDQVTTTVDMTAVDNTVNRSAITNPEKSRLFSGSVFFIASNIRQKLARNVQHQIINNGGVCTTDAEKATFIVVDTFSKVPSQYPGKQVVTYMWIQRCIQAKEQLNISSCTAFSPQLVPNDCSVLKNCVISYTQSYELSHLSLIVEKLGGVCQGTFTNKPIVNHKKYSDSLPCTHLIYKTKDSQKYSLALRWNIPAVKIEWLYSCLANLVKISPKNYQCRHDVAIVRDEKCATLTKLSGALDHGEQLKKNERDSAVLVDKDGFATPVKPRNKLCTKQVLSALESPACPPVGAEEGKSFSSLSVLYKKNISNAVKKTSPSNKILAGVTLVIKLNKQVDVPGSELRAIARRNGATIKSVIDRVKESKDTNIEAAVRQHGVKVVSYHWLLASDEQQAKLSEQDFPPGFDPKRALSISVSEETVMVQAVDINNTVTTETGMPQDGAAGGMRSPAGGKGGAATTSTSISPGGGTIINTQDEFSLDEDLRKEISMMEKLASESEDRKPPSFATPGTPKSIRRPKRSTFERRRHHAELPGNDLQSQQPLTITYDDGSEARAAFYAQQYCKAPDDTLNSSNIPTHINPSSSSTPTKPQEVGEPAKNEAEPTAEADPLHDLDPDELEVTTLSDTSAAPLPAPVTSPPTKTRSPRDYRFLLSGMNNEEKDSYEDMIEKLGGVFLKSSNYESSCTHLIVSKPNRNEKYLAGIGAGVYALHPSYLEDSLEQGKLLPESQYLWCNFAESLRGVARLLAAASNLWIGKQAFKGWNVMFFVSPSRVANFRGIVAAGGGVVAQHQPPYIVQRSITHALFEGERYTKPDVPLKALLEAGIPCLKLEYIPEYLVSGGSSETLQSCLVEPAQKHTKRSYIDEDDHENGAGSTPSKRYKR